MLWPLLLHGLGCCSRKGMQTGEQWGLPFHPALQIRPAVALVCGCSSGGLRPVGRMGVGGRRKGSGVVPGSRKDLVHWLPLEEEKA